MLQIFNNYFYSVGLLLVLFIGSIAYKKRLSVPVTFLWMYAALSSLYPAFSIYWDGKGYLNPIFSSLAKMSAAQSLMLVLLIPMSFLFVPRGTLLKCLKIYFIFEAATVVLMGHTITLGWSSYASVMLALSIFLFWERKHDLDVGYLIFIVAASFYNISVTTIVIYIFALSVYFWERHRLKVMWGITSAICLFIVIQPAELTTGNGRWIMWGQLSEVYINQLPKIFGTGLGTWEWIGPQIEGFKGIMGYYAVHNDFIQFMFETGYVGLFFLMWVIFDGFFKHRRNLNFIISVGSICLAMMTYFPLHIVAGQLMALYYFFPDRDHKTLG